MTHIDGCQIPGYQRVSAGYENTGPISPIKRLKRRFARPWNYLLKPQIKKGIKMLYAWKGKLQDRGKTEQVDQLRYVDGAHLEAGDRVRVRSREEIETTLDPFHELNGCAFLEGMWQYCDTSQRVLQPVRRFLDERDYQVKKARGVVLLESVLCQGTPVFGRCDRACHLFWREEWLAKIEG